MADASLPLVDASPFPRRTITDPMPPRSLASRRSPLMRPAEQLRALNSVPLASRGFDTALAGIGWDALRPAGLEILQINLGKLCNMTCRHCHVDAGPDRVFENMTRETVDFCLAALDRTSAHTVDITGGAPELNPNFRFLVEQCVARGKHIISRCNLTILLVPRLVDLPAWLAERGVEVVCSLPHYRKLKTDAQRGEGTFQKSVEALRHLNAVGYGRGDPRRRLTLVSNPAGASLPASQAGMERDWRAGLARNHGVTFDRLFVLNNMPINRFLEWLLERGQLQAYLQTLAASFNPATICGLMCRSTLSVAWDGTLYDCDFNQMLEIPVDLPGGGRPHVRDLALPELLSRRIRTGSHCFGCTAGSGSS